MLAINRLLVQAPAVTPAHLGERARGAWPVGAVLAESLDFRHYGYRPEEIPSPSGRCGLRTRPLPCCSIKVPTATSMTG